jgi:protein involved in ribonucleotide reduction
MPSTRIPIEWNDETRLEVNEQYILFVPTYGAGKGTHVVPRQVKQFLNHEGNRLNLKGIVGMGNTNFGEHYCQAAEVISAKTGASILGRVEIFGTPEDVTRITTIIQDLNTKL